MLPTASSVSCRKPFEEGFIQARPADVRLAIRGEYFAAYLGAIGAFFAGSCTISNLTFGPIQDSKSPPENPEETAFSFSERPTERPTAAPGDLAAALQVLASLTQEQLGAVLNLSRAMAAE